MPLFSFPQGTPGAQQRACLGSPVNVNLTTQAGGNSQNGYIASSDYQIVTTADASNKSITLPDPNKYGGTLGDQWFIANGQSGQNLSVFPPTGGNIDGAGANTAVTVNAGTTAMYILVSYTSSTSVWIGDSGT